jgi:putative nucleotidyltransferase with HDIG domain
LDAPIDRGLTATEAYTPSGGYASLRQVIREKPAQSIRSIAWAAILIAGTAGVVAALWFDGYRLPPLWAILVLGGIAAVAERQGVALSDRTAMSVSFLPLVFAAIAFGPLGGLTVGAISNIWDFGESRLKWAVYTPIRALTAATAGAAAWTFVPHPTGLGHYLLVCLIASLADLVAEGVLVGTTARIRGLDTADLLLSLVSVSWLTVPFYVPLLALLVFTYNTYSLGIALTLFVPTLAAQRLLHLYQQEKEATRHLAAANSRLLTANARFATGLVAMLEESDPYTAGHSLAVATYSRDIAERMGLSDDDVDLVHLCALVHDIGKYRLPKSVLEKDGPLTLEERRLMEKHPEYGEELLRKVEVEDHGRIGKIVRHHHERIDGEGYPDRLPESEIPLLSKVISVADAYNAMTSKRSYRDAMPSQVARLRLAQAVGSQFDTSVVAAFEAILATSDEDYRTAVGSRFVFDWNEAVDAEAIALIPLKAAS